MHKPGIIWITNAFICIIYVGYAVHWTEDRANWVSMQYMYIIFLNKSEKVYRIFFILIVHTVKVVIYAMGKITQVTQYKSCIWAKNRINVFRTTLNFKFFYIPMHWDTCILTFFFNELWLCFKVCDSGHTWSDRGLHLVSVRNYYYRNPGEKVIFFLKCIFLFFIIDCILVEQYNNSIVCYVNFKHNTHSF